MATIFFYLIEIRIHSIAHCVIIWIFPTNYWLNFRSSAGYSFPFLKTFFEMCACVRLCFAFIRGDERQLGNFLSHFHHSYKPTLIYPTNSFYIFGAIKSLLHPRSCLSLGLAIFSMQSHLHLNYTFVHLGVLLCGITCSFRISCWNRLT